MVAHRIETVMGADRIVVMGHGSVLEQGSPAELVGAGGQLATLRDSQTSEAGPEAKTSR